MDETDDATARKLGVPIYELLGGKLRDKLKVYAWIGGDRPGDVETQAYVPTLRNLSNLSMVAYHPVV
jgi:galactonate dehydratase